MAITSAFDGSEIKFDATTSWQDVFNHVYCAMAQQGRFAYVAPRNRVWGFCQYLALNGDRCAIGHCFSAEEAQAHAAINLNAEALIRREPDAPESGFAAWCAVVDGLAGSSVALKLQRCHDEPAQRREPFSECLELLQAFAGAHGLTVPAVVS